jgi:hypothetical protein
LDAEVGLAREEPNQGIDTDNRRAKDASFKDIRTYKSSERSANESSRTYTTHAAQNPPAGVIVDTPRRQPHGEFVSSLLRE